MNKHPHERYAVADERSQMCMIERRKLLAQFNKILKKMRSSTITAVEIPDYISRSKGLTRKEELVIRTRGFERSIT